MSAPGDVLQTWAANMSGPEPHAYAEECTPDCAAGCAGVPSYGAVVRARLLAEAWAWRCADTMPDSAQSRRDALADAEALLRFAHEHTVETTSHRRKTRSGSVPVLRSRRVWRHKNAAPIRALMKTVYRDGIALAARAAFRAVPGLRGEP